MSKVKWTFSWKSNLADEQTSFSFVHAWLLIFDGIREEVSDGIRFYEAQQKVSKTQVPKYGLLANIKIILEKKN